MGAGLLCKSEQSYTCNSVALSHHYLPGFLIVKAQVFDFNKEKALSLALAHYCECETSRWFVDNFIRDQLHAGHPLHPGGAGLLLLLSVLAGDAAHYWLRHAADHHRVSLRGGPRLAPGR